MRRFSHLYQLLKIRQMWSQLGISFLSRIYRARRLCRYILVSLRTPIQRARLRISVLARLGRLPWWLATLYRRVLIPHVKIVAVVGSFGKTTTRRTIAAALGDQSPDQDDWNARAAIAYSVLRIRPWKRLAVLEVGIGRKGVMGPYARTVRPNVAVVTSIGSEHLSQLGSLMVTRSEKAKMVEAVPPTGRVFLNGDDENVLWMQTRSSAPIETFGFSERNDYQASKLQRDQLNGIRFDLQHRGESVRVSSRFLGEHMAYPLMAAYAVGRYFGVSSQSILQNLATLESTRNRLQLIEVKEGVHVVLDACKATLETIETAIETVRHLPAKRKVMIMGDVEEPPGSQGPIYRALGIQLGEVFDRAILVGGKTNLSRLRVGTTAAGLSKDAVTNLRNDPQLLASAIREELKPGSLILVKGRSTQHLERAVLSLIGWHVTCSIRFCAWHRHCTTCPYLTMGS